MAVVVFIRACVAVAFYVVFRHAEWDFIIVAVDRQEEVVAHRHVDVRPFIIHIIIHILVAVHRVQRLPMMVDRWLQPERLVQRLKLFRPLAVRCRPPLVAPQMVRTVQTVVRHHHEERPVGVAHLA